MYSEKSEIFIHLDPFSKQIKILVFYRVTDDALIAETMVWPIFLSHECFLYS